MVVSHKPQQPDGVSRDAKNSKAANSVLLSYGHDTALAMWLTPIAKVLIPPILPMFFALSGFLVAGSLERCKSLVSFFGLRILRIFPASAVEVTLSALLLGPTLTTYGFQTYIQDPAFRAYFLNVLGYIHYVLPGVFMANPFPGVVNGQLWTVPFELEWPARRRPRSTRS